VEAGENKPVPRTRRRGEEVDGEERPLLQGLQLKFRRRGRAARGGGGPPCRAPRGSEQGLEPAAQREGNGHGGLSSQSWRIRRGTAGSGVRRSGSRRRAV